MLNFLIKFYPDRPSTPRRRNFRQIGL